MPGSVTVDLGSFTVSSYLDKNFVLTLSTSMLLSLPAHYSDVPKAAYLRDQVNAGSLWITRAPSCHIELNIGWPDSLAPHTIDQLQRIVVDAFEVFPGWNALGLHLKREYSRFHDPRGGPSLYPYSVHHDQQNASLIAPEQVPCAHFSVLACSLAFGARSPLTCSRQSTRPHKQSKIVMLQVPPTSLRAIVGIPELYSLPREVQAKRLEHLTHAALHSILGSHKRLSGIRVLKTAGSLAALDIAPAVWSPRYVQDVVSRAQMASLVSSALGALISTASPVLGSRIQSLGNDHDHELYRQTLLLILRSVRVRKIQYHGQQSSFQARNPQRNVVGDFLVGSDRVVDEEDLDDEHCGPAYLWEAQEAPAQTDTLLLDVFARIAPDDVSETAENYDRPGFEPIFDLEARPESEWPYSDSDRPGTPLDPALPQESVKLVGGPMLDVESLKLIYTPGQPRDNVAAHHQGSLFVEEIDRTYTEDEPLYSLAEHLGWEQVRSDFRDSVELNSSFMTDVETFEDGFPRNTSDNTRVLQPDYGLYLEDMEDTDVEYAGDAPMYPSGESVDRAYSSVGQDSLYEDDGQSDELMRDAWLSSGWEHGDEVLYADEFHDIDTLRVDGEISSSALRRHRPDLDHDNGGEPSQLAAASF